MKVKGDAKTKAEHFLLNLPPGDPGGGPDDLSPLDDDEEDEDESDDLEGDSLGPEDDCIDVDGIDGRKFDLVESGRSPSGRHGRDGGPTTNPAVERAMNALKFVAQHVKNEDNFEGVSDVRPGEFVARLGAGRGRIAEMSTFS